MTTRRAGVVLGLGLVVALTTACGRGASSPTPAQGPATVTATVTATVPAAPQQDTAAAGATPTLDGPDTSNLAPVGTFTQTGPGLQVSEAVKFGPLQYAPQTPVPHAYFAACNQDYTSMTDTAAFAVVDLTVTEDRGTFPESGLISGGIGVGMSIVPGVIPIQAALALNVDGSIVCDLQGPETGGIPITVRPQQPVHVTGYVVLPSVLSSANPTAMTKQNLNDFGFGGAFHGSDLGLAVKVSGPQAVDCGDGPLALAPFASLPFTQDQTTCRRVG